MLASFLKKHKIKNTVQVYFQHTNKISSVKNLTFNSQTNPGYVNRTNRFNENKHAEYPSDEEDSYEEEEDSEKDQNEEEGWSKKKQLKVACGVCFVLFVVLLSVAIWDYAKPDDDE